MNVDLRACVGGDPGAWRAFVESCSGIIYGAVKRVIATHTGRGHRDDLEDPVQEVFVRLLKDDCRLLRTYDPERASLSTWLTLVARSVAIDHLRRRQAPTTLLEGTAAFDAGPGTAEPGPDIPFHVLTGRQRLVLRMLFDEGMSVTEAASVIGVDEQTIRSTKHKALCRLRDHLGAKP
jgi:RNA polymerase sigma-70 factor (ECF subfamily)